MNDNDASQICSKIKECQCHKQADPQNVIPNTDFGYIVIQSHQNRIANNSRTDAHSAGREVLKHWADRAEGVVPHTDAKAESDFLMILNA